MGRQHVAQVQKVPSHFHVVAEHVAVPCWKGCQLGNRLERRLAAAWRALLDWGVERPLPLFLGMVKQCGVESVASYVEGVARNPAVRNKGAYVRAGSRMGIVELRPAPRRHLRRGVAWALKRWERLSTELREAFWWSWTGSAAGEAGGYRWGAGVPPVHLWEILAALGEV